MTFKDAIVRAFIQSAILDWVKRKRKDAKFMNLLSGWKTYIAAALTLALIVLHLFSINIPGVDYTALGTIGAVMSVIFARNGASGDAAKALVASGTSSTVARAKAVIANTR